MKNIKSYKQNKKKQVQIIQIKKIRYMSNYNRNLNKKNKILQRFKKKTNHNFNKFKQNYLIKNLS